MIEHVERIVQELLSLVEGWMMGLAITVVICLISAAFLGLSLYKFDRESFLVALRRTRSTLGRGWGWILTALALLMQVYGMNELHHGLMERLSQQEQARYSATQDPGGSATTQRTPQVAYLETATRTQRIIIPPAVTSIDAVPGWSPEEARYGERPAVNVEDQLLRDDKAMVLNRTISVQRYVPMKLTKSDVDLKLSFKDTASGGPRLVYRGELNGRYTISNPFPETRRVHFSFPLPDNSGTLSGFHFKVNGKESPTQDINRGLDWEGDMAPGERALIEVGYTHLGAGSWSYDVTGRREPIADFHLAVHSDNADIKFLRGSLFPTRTDGGSLDWDLHNQITSQSISLYFPGVPTEQLIGNLFVFGPLSVVILAVLVVVWSRLRVTGTTAWRTTLACLACCGEYSLASYLIGYVPVALALVIAFSVGAALQWHCLGARLWLPVTATALAPFTFLAAGHTGLLLTSLSLVALALTIRETVSPERIVAAD